MLAAQNYHTWSKPCMYIRLHLQTYLPGTICNISNQQAHLGGNHTICLEAVGKSNQIQSKGKTICNNLRPGHSLIYSNKNLFYLLTFFITVYCFIDWFNIVGLINFLPYPPRTPPTPQTPPITMDPNIWYFNITARMVIKHFLRIMIYI